jgi:hypothetical protein
VANRRADRRGGGYDYLHAAVDDHSRLAYVEVLGDERAQTCARFWRRAHRWFAVHGVTVHRVLTDNGVGYRSRIFRTALAEGGVRHRRTRPYRPQTNGKVERFNRTLLEEWAYRRLYRSNAARDRALQPWVHRYNHHRAHTALGGRPPISRVNNLPGYLLKGSHLEPFSGLAASMPPFRAISWWAVAAVSACASVCEPTRQDQRVRQLPKQRRPAGPR